MVAIPRVVLFCLVLLLNSAQAAAERLPLVAAPEHYALSVAPDLEKERFDGQVAIRVRVLAPTSRFVLHAAGLTVRDAAAIAAGTRQPATVTVDAARELLTLELPRVVAPGIAELVVRYTGPIGRELRGFYISEANGRKYAVTQLQATDARRLFPAFDEPAFKATFDISAIVDAGDTAISNGAVRTIEPGPTPGKKTIRFDTTARMSSYLVALAVGDFVCNESRAGTIPVRICATPAQLHLTAFAADATAAALRYLNDYFAIDYPFGKLDLVAIPDFAAGAMENTGAVFFRESLLLVDQNASTAVKKRAALVIAHELAHQWFGNLVTLRWWDDLWLNEGFATWMETKAVAAWRPEWHPELDALQSIHTAMAGDALRSTRTVRTAAETPADIEALFDPIAYEKGGAILRMVEAFTGDAAFRGGVNAYLQAHRFDNATAEDFWSILTRATGQPVDRVMRSFVDQPGIPLVRAWTRCVRGSTTLQLSQEPLRNTPRGDDLQWLIPVCVETRGNGTTRQCALLDESDATMTIPGCDAGIVMNAGATGYFRTWLDDHARERFFGAPLEPSEQLMALADSWALMRTGYTGVDRFLDAVSRLVPRVEAVQVLTAMSTRVQFVHEYLTSPSTRPAFERWVRERFTPVLETLPAVGEEADRDPVQAALLRLLGSAGQDAGVLARARDIVHRSMSGAADAPVDGDVLDAAVPLAAMHGDAALYEQYLEGLRAATTPEQRYRFLYGLAAFRAPALVRRTLEFARSAAVRPQDRPLLFGRLLSNPAAREMAWKFIQSHWTELQTGMGAFGGTARIISGLDSFCDRDHRRDIAAFFETHPIAGAERTLAQTLENIDSCSRIASTQQSVLQTLFEAGGGSASTGG